MQQLLLRKTVEQIEAEAMSHGLKRSLGKWNLVSLGIGCIIGAGIFVMTGTAAAEHAGPALMLSFIFTGIACALVGLCYAELASVLPISGSAYTYAYATLGEALAWVMGWLLVLEYGVAASTVAVGWAGYINSFLLGFGVMIPPELTAATGSAVSVTDVYHPLFEAAGYTFGAKGELLKNGLAVLGVFNLPAFMGIMAVVSLLVVGVSESAKVNNIIVFIKVAVVLMFVVIGAFYVNPDNWHPFIPENKAPGVYGWGGIFRAASIIFFAYVGFEAVSTAAQEAKNPQKDMPFGILGSLLICTILYMGVSAVMTGIVPYPQLNVAEPMAIAVDKIDVSWLTVSIGGAPFKIFPFLIKVGAILGLSSVMMVLIYGQTRIFYVMGRDGLLPQFFCKVHPRFHTPYINTVVVGLIVAVTAGMTPISLLGDLVSLGTLLAFMIVCFSVLHLRKTQPGLPRPFRTPGSPVTPILGILTCGYLVYSIFFGTDATGAIVLTESGSKVLTYTGPYTLAGILIYAFYGMRHSKLRQHLNPVSGDVTFIEKPHENRVE